jgi:UDP-N-acetyl-D-glucosamine dehydrogenase
VACEVLAAFESKVDARAARVGISGLGYVGLPLALLSAPQGFTLQGAGARVDYHDPYFPHLLKMRKCRFDFGTVALSPEILADYEAVVIATDHSTYDHPGIVCHARLVVDTRNATHAAQEDWEKIVRC